MLSQCNQAGLTLCKTPISKTTSMDTFWCDHFVWWYYRINIKIYGIFYKQKIERLHLAAISMHKQHMHCILCVVFYGLYSIHYTIVCALYSMDCIICTVFNTLNSVHWNIFIVLNVLYHVHCCNVFLALYPMICIICIIFSALYYIMFYALR